jgi:translation elongation factor EF-Ts
MGLSGAGRRVNYMKLYIGASYSSFTSASKEMNLIKQLRERTSAPIKEGKTALVDSNWDIEATQKELRKRGIVLASKKSSRTASEGLFALAQTTNPIGVGGTH